MVFRPARVAVFIDGCFWHGCPLHSRPPKTNKEYWTAKIGGNTARDRQTNRLLADAGWKVIRAWEHDDALEVAERIISEVKHRRACR
jgi:DNA mismatch endonuclease, patch repair protein